MSSWLTFAVRGGTLCPSGPMLYKSKNVLIGTRKRSLVRIRAGGDQRWSSLPRPLLPSGKTFSSGLKNVNACRNSYTAHPASSAAKETRRPTVEPEEVSRFLIDMKIGKSVGRGSYLYFEGAETNPLNHSRKKCLGMIPIHVCGRASCLV